MNNKLILRSLESPFSDITKNSKLTIADGDNNFIFLKGSDLSAATTTGTVLSLIKNNGEIINVDISSVSGGTGQNTAIVSGTFSNETLTLYNTTGGTVVVTGFTSSSGSSGIEVYVTGGTANNNNKTYTFTNSTGGTFVVNALTDVYLSSGIYSNGILSLTNNTGGTINITGFTTGSSFFDTYITGATANNNNKTYTFTNNTGGTFVVNALTDITITGGTYNSGNTTLSLVNTTGGTISITGFPSTTNSTYITGGTYSNGITTLNNNTGGAIIISGYNIGNQVILSASTIDFNVTHQSILLSSNTTFDFINTGDAKTIIISVTNTINNYSVTWPNIVKWTNNLAPTQTIGAKTDIYTLVQINNNIYGSYIQNFT